MKQAIIVLKNLPNKERIKRILELRRSNAATPKKSLKIAPVYPIRADTSIFNKTNIRDKSIGFNKLTAIIGFSSGYSAN